MKNSSNILLIETSTTVCSVALATDGLVSETIETNLPNAHSSKLTVFIQDILKNNNLTIDQVSAVAVSRGPGSYTGLRIGASVAKGICYGKNIPLIEVCTLEHLVHCALKNEGLKNLAEKSEELLFCPMIDARRMEVYTALFNNKLEKIVDVHPCIIDENSFSNYFEKHSLLFFGNGADKCKPYIKNKNAIFLDGIEASASAMATIANTLFLNGQFADVAYFEPFYLKDFVTTIPKQKI